MRALVPLWRVLILFFSRRNICMSREFSRRITHWTTTSSLIAVILLLTGIFSWNVSWRLHKLLLLFRAGILSDFHCFVEGDLLVLTRRRVLHVNLLKMTLAVTHTVIFHKIICVGAKLHFWASTSKFVVAAFNDRVLASALISMTVIALGRGECLLASWVTHWGCLKRTAFTGVPYKVTITFIRQTTSNGRSRFGSDCLSASGGTLPAFCIGIKSTFEADLELLEVDFCIAIHVETANNSYELVLCWYVTCAPQKTL